MNDVPLERRWLPGHPLDLHRTLAPLRRGPGDPACRVTGDGAFWRASRTPAGPGTLCVTGRYGEVEARAWGPGAGWLLDRLPVLLGEADNPAELPPLPPGPTREAQRAHPGLRLCRTGLVLESLIPAILEQKVTSDEAYRAWRLLLRDFGTPAPGPAEGMRVAPSAREWSLIPSWEWHRAGVDPKRAATIQRAVRLAPGWSRRRAWHTPRPSPGSPPFPASASGRPPRPCNAATATRTRSRSATSTCRTSSAGRWPDAPAPTTPNSSPCSPPTPRTATGSAA